MENGSVVSHYLRYADSTDSLEREAENALVARALRRDPGATDQLLKRHIAPVIRIAMEFRGRGVPLEDLINEACLGFLKAIQRFDAGNGARFMTYAGFWVRKAILDALADQSRTIRIPRYQRERHRVPPKEVRLDDPVRAGEERTLGDGIADRSSLPAGSGMIRRETLLRLRHQFRALSIREQAVLASRFGLHGGPAMTLMQVGAVLGVSRERVRQIERAAITRLQKGIG